MADETFDGVEDTGGLSRRSLIKRGAIAGGLVWAAPVIRSVPAFASHGTGTPACGPFPIVDALGQVQIGECHPSDQACCDCLEGESIITADIQCFELLTGPCSLAPITQDPNPDCVLF